MSKNKSKQSGYVALMATIIISMTLLVMAIQEGASGWSARFNILGTEAKEQATALAEGCADQALTSLVTDLSYQGNITTVSSAGTCHVFPVEFNTPTAGKVRIKTQAEVKNSFANLELVTDMNDIHLGTPTPGKGTVIVVTQVINDGSGNALPSAFTMNVTATNASQNSFPGSNMGITITMDAGAYNITESTLPGYATTISTSCSGTITSGQVKFCTITNDDVTTTLTVIANVTNDNSGTTLPAHIPLFIDGAPVTLGTRNNVSSGPHTVSATAPSGYAASLWGYDCASAGTVTVPIGQSKTCIISFDDLPPPAPSCADTVMMLDRTGSMGGPGSSVGTDLYNEKIAANALVNLYAGVLPPASKPRLGVGVFGDGTDNNGLSPARIVGPLSIDYPSLLTAISTWLAYSEGWTNISDAITKANAELTTKHISNPPPPEVEKKKVIILVSDGDATKPTGTTNLSVTLSPNAEAANTAWDANTGTKVLAVATNDADTTYIAPKVMAETYTLAPANIPIGATNISVTLHAIAKRSSGTTANIALMAENGVASAVNGGHTLTTSYADYTWTMSTNPLGGAWTASEVNGWTTKFGVLNTSAPGNVPRVTELYAAVSYSMVTPGTVQRSPTGTMSSPNNQFTSANNAFTSNDSYATNSVNGHLQGYSNFSFNNTNIPTGSTITGIQVTTEARISGTASPANSPTLYPTSNGTYSQWTTGNFSTIDESGTPFCNNNDYVLSNGTDSRASFGIDISAIPNGSIINSVSVTVGDRGDLSAGGTYRTFIRVNTTDLDATGSALTATGSSGSACTIRTQTISAGSVVKSSGTTLQIGVAKISGNSNTVRVGTLNATINYTPPNTAGSLSIALSSNNGGIGSWTTATRSVAVDQTESVDVPLGNSTSDLWGRAWTPGDFNNGNFVIRLQNTTPSGIVISLDHVAVTVNYTTTNNLTSANLPPVSLGNYNNWSFVPVSGTAVSVVSTNDGDTSYISNASSALQTETFVFPNASIPTGATNIEVTLHATAKEVNGGSGNIRLIAERGASQPTDSGHPLSGTYTNYSWQMNTNPLGGAWTVAEVNSWTTFFGVRDNSTGGTVPRVTHLYLVVSYTISTTPEAAALDAADLAKRGPDGISGTIDDTNIFTIFFGSGNPNLLANLASGLTVVPGHESGSDFNLSGTPISGNIGPISPSIQVASSGGDSDGFERNPNNAFENGPSGVSGAAENRDSGNGGSSDRHIFSGYDFSALPPNVTITGVQTRLDWWLDSNLGTNSLGVELSWNGGVSWTSAKSITDEPTSIFNSDTLGGSADLWGHAWTASELSSANFRVRLTANATQGTRDFFLDWVPVRIYYSGAVPENTDSDNFFIAPLASDMKGIFNFIGEQVCPAALNLGSVAPPTTGTLIILTQAVNNNGGVSVSSDFTVNVGATNPSLSSFAGSVSGVSVTVNPGSYDVTETMVDGYNQIYGATCSSGSAGPIVAGETRVCVLVNDDIPPPPVPPNFNINTGSWQEVPNAN